MSETGEEDMINHSDYSPLVKPSTLSKIVTFGLGIFSIGALTYAYLGRDRYNTERDAKSKLVSEIFYQLDANRDKVLDPQESSPLVEKGWLPKGISLDELTRQLQEISQETLQNFLEERQPKK